MSIGTVCHAIVEAKALSNLLCVKPETDLDSLLAVYGVTR